MGVVPETMLVVVQAMEVVTVQVLRDVRPGDSDRGGVVV